MAKVIICIHGRADKPPKKKLESWWKSAIKEGLKESTTSTLENAKFHMAYYADIYYDDGPHQDDQWDGTYKKAKNGTIKSYEEGILDDLRKIAESWLSTPLDWLEEKYGLFSSTVQAILRMALRDLGEYYSNEEKNSRTKEVLRSLLLKHKDDEIILVAHSMGTIIAYEVLRELGRDEDHTGFLLSHFITLGSPLGLRTIQGGIFNNHRKIRTPSCVRGSWVNFSEPGDYVCLDSHLRDDYKSNSYRVRVRDIMVYNDNRKDKHSSYGYLRTPEFSEHLASLL